MQEECLKRLWKSGVILVGVLLGSVMHFEVQKIGRHQVRKTILVRHKDLSMIQLSTVSSETTLPKITFFGRHK